MFGNDPLSGREGAALAGLYVTLATLTWFE